MYPHIILTTIDCVTMMLEQTKRFRVTIKTFYQHEKRFVLRVTTMILPTYHTYNYGLCNDVSLVANPWGEVQCWSFSHTPLWYFKEINISSFLSLFLGLIVLPITLDTLDSIAVSRVEFQRRNNYIYFTCIMPFPLANSARNKGFIIRAPFVFQSTQC